MNKITITPLTPLGVKALDKHVEETQKLPLRQKLIFRTSGYRQVVEEGKVIIQCNNRYSSNPAFQELIIGEIKKAMKDNNADYNTDYKIEVE